MNRLEYLTQLRRLLEDGGLAEDEINDAMGFYEEIFLDAGAAHEAETAANLGSPEELANKILQDSGIHPQGDSVFQMEAAADPSQARDTDNKTLRKNLCKFKNCDKSDILERLKNNRSNFFTVYNGYCNLSRFFGYQPAGMESG